MSEDGTLAGQKGLILKRLCQSLHFFNAHIYKKIVFF